MIWIIRKELLRFFSDRRGAVLVIAMPLLLGVLMGLLFNPGKGPDPIRVGLVDQDGGPNVAALVARLGAEAALTLEPMEAEAARAAVAGGKLGVVILVPDGSDEELVAASLFSGGERPALPLWVDPSEGIEADIVAGLLTKAMMETVFGAIGDPAGQKQMFGTLRGQIDAAERPELAKFLDQGLAWSDEGAAGGSEGGGGGLEPPLRVVKEEVVAAGPDASFSSHAHTFAGMLMQFLLFSASTGAKLMVREREEGLYDRLRTTRVRDWEILLGAAAGTGLVSVLASAVVFGAGGLFFDIPFRSGLPALALVVLAQGLFVGAFQLLLVGLAPTEKQIDGIGMLVILTLCFLSGAWVPSFMLPAFLQEAGPLLPTRWLLDGMAGATWRGLGLGHALRCAGALTAFSLAFTGIGLRRFRW